MAYAALDPKVGYVQGLNLMAAFFLNTYQNNEKDSFLMFVWLMRGKLKHRRTFSTGFPQMREQMTLLIDEIKSRDAALYQHIIRESQGLDDVFFYGCFTSILLTYCIYEVDVDSTKNWCEENN